MKMGKDDEKIMGPMFPRLHVNDAETGGPRAPPRNKMALYEQLSIPSQRFNAGVVPLNPSNTSSLVPHGSLRQGSSLERNMLSPSRVSPSMSTHPSEKFHARQLGSASVNDPSKKVRDEDDFMVPVFVNSETGRQHNKAKNGFDGEKLTPLGPTYSDRQVKVQNVRDKDPNRSSTSVVSLRKEVREQSEESSKVCLSRGRSVKNTADLSTREKINAHAEEANGSPGQGCGEHFASRVSRSNENDVGSVQKLRAGREASDSEGLIPWQRSMSYSEWNQCGPDETNNDSDCRGDKTCVSVQCANGDKSDDVSETSMVDSISGLDISPDDVVGIIGQKHFWKARRAIVNQQRLFAVQVFELHRLIKVQRLIAGSPHILLEDTAYLSKPSFKGSPAEKLPPEFSVKPLPHTKRKDDSEKPSNKVECSAENAVGRTSLSFVKSGSQPSNCASFLGNQPSTPVNVDNKMNYLGFHQMPGHQWLVPIMSPSEGLIYKPYPGSGFMGSACGGCGPFEQTPMPGNFMTSAYGVPIPSHPGIGVLPATPPVGHSYFPPYGMPVMNPAVSGSAVEQVNQFAGPRPYAHYGQFSGGGANFNMQHQSSCNLPSEKNSAVSHVRKFQASKDTELQGSTASSPGERVQRDGANNAGGKNALSLFPTDPAISEGGFQRHETDRRTRVIKVVPHNARSATESAARIFQSIQEERKQYDSV